MRIEELEIDSIGDDLPVRLEIPVVSDRRGVRDGDCGGKSVERFLETLVHDPVKERAVEIRVKRPDYRAFGSLDGEHRQHRIERRVHVNYVILPAPEDVLQL